MAISQSSADLAHDFFDTSRSMLCILDHEGHVLRVNASWAALFGPVAREPPHELLQDRTTDQQSSTLAGLIRALDKQGGWVGQLRTATGAHERFILQWDVDARGFRHTAVRRAIDDTSDEAFNRRARAFFARTELGILELSLGGEIIGWNPAAETIFGYSVEEAVGKHAAQLLQIQDHELTRGTIAKGLTSTGMHLQFAPCQSKDGRRVACVWHYLLLRDDHGAAFGISVMVKDVTAVEEQRRTLEERTRLLRVMLDNTPVVLWAIDHEGRLTFSDGSALGHLGQKDGEAVGRFFEEVYGAVPEVVALIRQALEGNASTSRCEIGGRDWETHLIPLRGPEAEMTGVLGLFFDITQRGQLERELREHIGILEQQRSMIRALSAPILQIWDEVLAMPIIGHVDAARAEAMMETLLDEIVRTQSRYAILDVTGVDTMDTSTVHHLARLLRAMSLLGAEGILTGVRPAVATSLVELGADLPRVPTLANLRAGLQRCIRGLARGG